MGLPTVGASQMQPQNPLIVRTEQVSVDLIGYRMGDMRNWLDHNRIDLTDFKLVTLGAGNIVFDAQFRDMGQAIRFRAAFGGSAPSTRQGRPVTLRRWPWRYRRAA
jgi:hypothetical protein